MTTARSLRASMTRRNMSATRSLGASQSISHHTATNSRGAAKGSKNTTGDNKDNPIIISDEDGLFTLESTGNRLTRQKNQAIHRQSALEKTVCLICTTELPTESFPRATVCIHPVRCCRTCMSSWVSSRIEASNVKIPCPECRLLFTDDDVKAFVSQEVFNRYESLLLKSALRMDPEFHWCIGPDCQSGQAHADSNPIFTCHQCGFRSCVEHNIKWHTGLTCAQFDANRENATEKIVQEISVQCPGCGWRIEKSAGCDHMTCSMCRTEFCYLCKAGYDDIRMLGNDAHKKDCRYHPGNSPKW